MYNCMEISTIYLWSNVAKDVYKRQVQTDGVLILLNTLGGDVEAGLAIAEMIASLSKPTVSLVLGGCHSIGGPLAVSADYSFIVPSGTMIIHPVRTSGMFIGVAQSLRNIEKTQDRITGFLAEHSGMSQERIEELLSLIHIFLRVLLRLLLFLLPVPGI